MEWLLILAALALIAMCGLFVAAEFALVTVDRASLERAADSGDRAAAGGVAALRTLSTQLSGAQIGITITNLAIGFLAEPAIADLIDEPLADLGLGEGLAGGVAVALALFLSTVLTMVFGELVPKNLAIARPLEVVRAAPIRVLAAGGAHKLPAIRGALKLLEPTTLVTDAATARKLTGTAR